MKFKNFLIIFLLLFFNFVSYGFAGDSLKDFNYQYEQYHKIYDQFLIARDRFLKYRVLNSQEEAIKSLKNLLLQRNQTLRTYYLALMDKIRKTPGIVSQTTNSSLLSRLDKKVLWLEDQNRELNQLNTPAFEDLFIISDRIETEKDLLINLGYEALGEMILGKIRSLHQDSVTLTSLIKEELNKYQQATNSARLNLWLKEVEVKNYLAAKEIEAGEINLWNLKSKQDINSALKDFENIKIDALDAKIQLTQGLGYLKEIYKELVKNGN